jgi:protein SCO1/2
MDRRRFLQTASVVGAASVAGCVGTLGDPNPNVVLGKPDRDADVTSEQLPYPAWGQQVPDVTLPAPVADEQVSLRDVSTPSVLTFFFSNCTTMCPVLVGTLREAQIHSVTEGYADEVTFLPVTFDPARDDAETLRSYAERMNVDTSAGNWHFLRPESEARAKEVVTDQFGVFFEQDGEGEGHQFTHLGLVLLVNGDGYVERAYRGTFSDQARLIEDLRTVRSA